MKDAPKSKSPDEQPDVDREIELRAMANMLRRSQGFTLAFVQCNQPSERRKLVSELRQLLGDYPVAEVEFTEPIEQLLDELLSGLQRLDRCSSYSDDSVRALFVYGLERSIRSEREFSPLVANLNVSRNLFPRHISHSLVFWLPAFAITAIMRGAPDFFSWRSSLFRFPSPPEVLAHASQDALDDEATVVFNLTLEEKKERITVIENLLADYEFLPPDNRDRRRAEMTLLDRLAMLHYSLGDFVKAEGFYQRSLAMGKELDDKGGIAVSLHQLGRIAHFRENYEEAERYYQQSLKIKKELRDKMGIAGSLYQLGVIARYRGDYEVAEHYCKQSLNIFEELKDKIGIAISLHKLGRIAHFQENYEEAERYYRQSLKIKKELRNKIGIAISLRRLGEIAELRGNYEEAERCYRQSVNIFEKLGSKIDIADSLHKLGMIIEEQERYGQATRLIAAALALFEQTGLPHQVARESLARLREQIEEKRFEALFKEAYAAPEAVVRETLSK